MSTIPVADLRATIAQARPQWEARVRALFERSQFVLGPEGAEFEREFSKFLGAGHCVTVSSGTSAIELSLRDAKVSGEVLTTALTAPFTGIGILAAGAAPKFADIDPETLQMDVNDAGNRLGKHIRALLPVHLYGQPVELAGFRGLAQQKRIPMIQDACQAHGATYRGRPLAAFSAYVCYSFYPTKNLGCLGDGGGIVTNGSAAARRLRQWRDGGRRGGQVSYFPGANSRLDEIQACYLRAFLPHLETWNLERARLARLYDSALANCDGVRLPRRDAGTVHHLYVVRAQQRPALRKHLERRGVGTGVHYPVPLHLHPAFQGARQKRGDLPQTERACKEVLSLPLWPGLAEAQLERVVEGIRSFYC